MKIYLLLLFALLTNTLNAQIKYRNVSFAEALRMAKAESKMMLLQFESEDCNQCNEVADKGMEDIEVAKRIEQTFVPIKISPKHPDRSFIELEYNMVHGFGTLFIDMNGSLMHVFKRSTTFSKEYLNQIDLALYSTSESARITQLEKEYKSGNREPGFVESLLAKRKILNLATDSLLDGYISNLPSDSLQSLRTLVFIAQLAPMIGSKADMAMHRDPQLFNRAWYSMSLPVRIGINNAIINKGMKKAINERNESFAVQTASFAQITNGSNYAAATKAYDKNLLYFYEKTDTSKYFMKAIAYYDRYLMSVSVDSIKRKDSLTRNNLLTRAPLTDTTVNGRQGFRAAISYAPVTQFFTQELNSGAWSFYKMTNNPYLLSVATEWAKKGLEFYRSPEILDTYARLLYKQNQKEQAITIQSEAIMLQNAHRLSTKEYDLVLDKMKKNETVD